MAEDNEGLDSKERCFFQLSSEFSKLEEREKRISENMEQLESRQEKLKIECEEKDAKRVWLDSLAKSTLDAEALKVVERLIEDNNSAECKKELATIEEDIRKLRHEDTQMKERLSHLEEQEKSIQRKYSQNSQSTSQNSQNTSENKASGSSTSEKKVRMIQLLHIIIFRP